MNHRSNSGNLGDNYSDPKGKSEELKAKEAETDAKRATYGLIFS